MEQTKKERVVSTEYDPEAETVTVTVKGFAPIVLRIADVSQEVLQVATYKGFVARLTDAAALGKDATPLEKYEAVKALADYYNGGATEWERAGGGKGGGGFSRTEVIEAIIYVYGWDLSTVEAKLAKLAARDFGGDEKAALKHLAASDKVRERIDEARRAKRPNLSSDSLLEGL